MKIVKYNLLFILSLIMFSCYSDESKNAENEIDIIKVTSVQKDSIYLYLGNEIVITPEIPAQTKDVTFSWSIGTYSVDVVDKVTVTTVFKSVSEEKEFVYKPEKLGHYYVRLIATNQFGSTIKYYHVFINAEYEEGFLILGKRADGINNISFMKTLTPSEIEQGQKAEFKQNAFAYTNGGKVIEGNAIDIEKVGASIFILCADSKKVLKIHAKTFQLEYVYDLSVISNDLKPLTMNGYDSNYCRELYFPSADGGVAKLIIADFEVFWDVRYLKTTKFNFSIDRYNYSSSKKIYNLDADNLLWLEGFYAPTMAFKLFSVDVFKNREIIGAFVDENGNFIAFNRDGAEYKITKLDAQGYSFETKEVNIHYDNVLTENTNLINKQTKIHHNDTYSCVFFNNGGNIYKWHYNQNSIPATPFVTLPVGEKIVQITSYPYAKDAAAPSGNETEIHILTHNASRTPLSGSLYRYSAIDGSLIEKYEGVSDEPIVTFYKIK